MRVGDTLVTAYALDDLGVLAWCHGDLAEAQLTASLRVRVEIGAVRGNAFIQHDLACVALGPGLDVSGGGSGSASGSETEASRVLSP